MPAVSVVHGRSDGKDQCGSSGGRGSLSSPLSGGGDCPVTREEGSESSLNSSGRTRAGQL